MNVVEQTAFGMLTVAYPILQDVHLICLFLNCSIFKSQPCLDCRHQWVNGMFVDNLFFNIFCKCIVSNSFVICKLVQDTNIMTYSLDIPIGHEQNARNVSASSLDLIAICFRKWDEHRLSIWIMFWYLVLTFLCFPFPYTKQTTLKTCGQN